MVKHMKTAALIILLLAPCVGAAAAEMPAKPGIQVALLLDTSNSMDGLIEQAKAQLWRMVNEFTAMKRDGMAPDIRVGLYEYGNDRLSPKEQWIRQVLPLTDDLDKVSQQLFALTTNGGTECCGAVIKTAVENLEWSASANDLKVIIIAGNEPFTQGEVNYAESCKAAIAKGIIVNTIHCGGEAEGITGKWKDGAMLADGQFMCIDQDREIVQIAAPQDKALAELSVELNTTYIPYGDAGREGAAMQAAQEGNAASVSSSVVSERAKTKSSASYRNSRWDLVDAVEEDKVKVEEVKAEDLPEAMQKMSVEERKAHVETNAKKRAEIQAKILELSKARETHIAEERRKLAEEGQDTLDEAILKAVRLQAADKKFETK